MISGKITSVSAFLFVFTCICARADFPEYETNPFSFAVEDYVYGYGCGLFAVDLNSDTLLDYTYRSATHLYAYDHYGSLMWKKSVTYPAPYVNVYGSKHAAADFDGDGRVEIAALNDSNQVRMFDGETGAQEWIFDVEVGVYQKASSVIAANLRGQGDRDFIIQTTDIDGESESWGYYANRSVAAYNAETKQLLWRVYQDRDFSNGIYEGYWGPAHGTLQVADVDGDGMDEVVGGNMIEENGTLMGLGYPTDWIGYSESDGFVDHLDGVVVGDYRPDLPGLEWLVCEENWYNWEGQDAWCTTLLNRGGKIWRYRNVLPDGAFILPDHEPQTITAGNYSTDAAFTETWMSSRFPNARYSSQRPCVLAVNGTQIAAYRTIDTFPANFNQHANQNAEGIEPTCTIDWVGGRKEYIAARARHDVGNVGVFDAMTGLAVWTTVGMTPAIEADAFYVADVAGDGREEVLIHDQTDGTIKIFWNTDPSPSTLKPDKWDDPLYRRIKQNYNLYSTGGYTYGDYPLIADTNIDSITTCGVKISWTTDVPADSRVHYGTSASYENAAIQDTATLVQNHVVRIDSLLPNQVYHFQVESQNVYHKAGLICDMTFRTLAMYLKLRLFLEATYAASGDTMSTTLNAAGFIPTTSPYAEDPRDVDSVPSDAVDWVLIQLRPKADSAAVTSRSAFLRKDGMVFSGTDTAAILDLNAHDGGYYVVVKHRNHLSVMTSDTVSMLSSDTVFYDFSSELVQYYGGEARKIDDSPLRFGLYSSDANGNKYVNATDYLFVKAKIGFSGYSSVDCNLNGFVNATDYLYIKRNIGKMSSVP